MSRPSRATFNGRPRPRYCGGGCLRDLNGLPEDMLSFEYPAMCIDCAEIHEARLAAEDVQGDE